MRGPLLQSLMLALLLIPIMAARDARPRRGLKKALVWFVGFVSCTHWRCASCIHGCPDPRACHLVDCLAETARNARSVGTDHDRVVVARNRNDLDAAQDGLVP